MPLLLEPAFDFFPGTAPLLISIPHAGTFVPREHRAHLTEEAAALPDTDWHVPLLYGFAREMGASLLVARYARLVIDLNRGADDAPLYAGPMTGLFSDTLFDGSPCYRQPVPEDWRSLYMQQIWLPYHTRLRRELEWMRSEFGRARLLDAHSIRSVIPRLFSGELPHLNLGTNDGRSANAALVEDITGLLFSSAFSVVRDARFKGGYITRQYGQPSEGIEAVQLEIAQRAYMDEATPGKFDPRRAEVLGPLLHRLVARLLAP